MRAVLTVFFGLALALPAQQPRFENARVENKAVSGNLDSTVRALIAAQTAPAWIGYAVPIIPGDRRICGWDGGHTTTAHMSLEGPTVLFVLYRIEQNEITKIRTATPDCEIDGGGLPVTWLTEVQPADSVRFLNSLVSRDKLVNSAVGALAMHKDPSAVLALEAMLAPAQPDKLREKAVMWLSVAGGRYERLIQAAREDPSPRVRGQALFWLSQGARKKLAVDAIARAIENDPETEVKKKAVFALSQLPAGDGVPKLIEVAKSNKNIAVRKQALFWLGQSKDPRALNFFEQILTR